MNFKWEKECYYNERGTISLNSSDKIETNNYVNIILTGTYRSGKSTLINVLSQKLVSRESPFMESEPNQIEEYKVITSEKEFLTGLRFFVTPGLIKNKNISIFKEVKNAIDSKIKENKDSRDEIHLIYFLTKSYTNLDDHMDFFEYIIEINKKRKEEGKKKINMIFIINQGIESSEPSLIEFLNDNNLFKDLIEKIDESNEIKEKKILKINLKTKIHLKIIINLNIILFL